jgi:uncharacterized membrane protein YfcA
MFLDGGVRLDYGVLGGALIAALSGAYLGNRHLKKITMTAIQKIVAMMLFAVALGLISGLL